MTWFDILKHRVHAIDNLEEYDKFHHLKLLVFLTCCALGAS